MSSKMRMGKPRRRQRKLDAIARKEEKIAALEKQLKEQNEMDGRGFNPIKQANPGVLESAISRKKTAVRRKKRKLGIEDDED